MTVKSAAQRAFSSVTLVEECIVQDVMPLKVANKHTSGVYLILEKGWQYSSSDNAIDREMLANLLLPLMDIFFCHPPHLTQV